MKRMYVSIKTPGEPCHWHRMSIDVSDATTPTQAAKRVRKEFTESVNARPASASWAVYVNINDIVPVAKSSNWRD